MGQKMPNKRFWVYCLVCVTYEQVEQQVNFRAFLDGLEKISAFNSSREPFTGLQRQTWEPKACFFTFNHKTNQKSVCLASFFK